MRGGLYVESWCYGPGDTDAVVDPASGFLRRCTEAERAEAKAAGRTQKRFWDNARAMTDMPARCRAGDEAACTLAGIESPRQKQVVKEREEFAALCPSLPAPAVGMTPEQAVGTQWGRPGKINTTVTGSHRYEQWVYSPGFYNCLFPNFVKDPDNGRGYLYFTDGILTGMQY